MSYDEFMRKLGSLLEGVPAEEREEALQYYSDYFADAGKENEEQVIRELGSPEKVAALIKAGLRGGTDGGEFTERGYMDEQFVKKDGLMRREAKVEEKEQNRQSCRSQGESAFGGSENASYGNNPNGSGAYGSSQYSYSYGDASYANGNASYGNTSYGNGNAAYGAGNNAYSHGNSATGNDTYSRGNSATGSNAYSHGNSATGNNAYSYGNGANGNNTYSQGSSAAGSAGAYNNGRNVYTDGMGSGMQGNTAYGEKRGPWTNRGLKILLIVLIVVFASPVIFPLAIGVVATVFGLACAAFGIFLALVICAGAITSAGFAIICDGLTQLFFSPPEALLAIGFGLLIFVIGLIAVAASVRLCTIIFPALFRFFVGLCRKPFDRKRM